MNAGGLSKARLGRMHDVMAGYGGAITTPKPIQKVSRSRTEIGRFAGTVSSSGRSSRCKTLRSDMVGILLTQRAWTSPVPPAVRRDFWTLAYQAIDD
jgi:hypothetical protein